MHTVVVDGDKEFIEANRNVVVTLDAKFAGGEEQEAPDTANWKHGIVKAPANGNKVEKITKQHLMAP